MLVWMLEDGIVGTVDTQEASSNEPPPPDGQDGGDSRDADSGPDEAGAPVTAEDGGAGGQAAPGGSEEVIAIIPDAAQTYGEKAQTIKQALGVESQGISALGVTLFIASLVLAIIVRLVVVRLMDGYLKKFVEATETDYDDKILAALRKSVSYFIYLGGLFLAFSFIDLPVEPLDIQGTVWRVLNTFFLVASGMLVYRIIEITLSFVAAKRTESGSELDAQFMPLVRDIVKVVIIVLVVVAVVQSWGYSAAGILTGVGISGLALAFAAQDTVANIFGSFMIYADRPYRVGDWVLMSGVEGTVEQIGIRSTRIRKFDKTVVSVPNKNVTNECIQNFSEMPIRRIKLYVGLSYEASTGQVRKVVEATREMLKNHNGVDQRFWMVNFTEMAQSSLDMIVYCFTETTVWKEYMDIRQDILLKIIDICKDHGVDIAFPSRTIYHRHIENSPDINLPPDLRRGGPEDLPKELRRGAPSGLPRDLEKDGLDRMEHDTADSGGDA